MDVVLIVVVTVCPLMILRSNNWHLATSKALVKLWILSSIRDHLPTIVIHTVCVVVDRHDVVALVP